MTAWDQEQPFTTTAPKVGYGRRVCENVREIKIGRKYFVFNYRYQNIFAYYDVFL